MPDFAQSGFQVKKTGRPLVDLTGRRFGSYLVLRRGPDKYPRVRNGYHLFQPTWVCRCDCGRETTRSSQQVKTVFRCLYCHNAGNALPGNEGAKRNLLHTYQSTARYKRIPWLLSDSDFFRMTQENCHYCGKSPIEEPVTRAKSSMYYREGNSKSISTLCYNGLDRVDSYGPYEKINVVTCCGPCNHAKFSMPYDVFIKWINRIRGSANA